MFSKVLISENQLGRRYHVNIIETRDKHLNSQVIRCYSTQKVFPMSLLQLGEAVSVLHLHQRFYFINKGIHGIYWFWSGQYPKIMCTLSYMSMLSLIQLIIPCAHWSVDHTPGSFGLVWLISRSWKYYWLIWCERKILFVGWKSTAYKPNKTQTNRSITMSSVCYASLTVNCWMDGSRSDCCQAYVWLQLCKNTAHQGDVI